MLFARHLRGSNSSEETNPDPTRFLSQDCPCNRIPSTPASMSLENCVAQKTVYLMTANLQRCIRSLHPTRNPSIPPHRPVGLKKTSHLLFDTHQPSFQRSL